MRRKLRPRMVAAIAHLSFLAYPPRAVVPTAFSGAVGTNASPHRRDARVPNGFLNRLLMVRSSQLARCFGSRK